MSPSASVKHCFVLVRLLLAFPVLFLDESMKSTRDQLVSLSWLLTLLMGLAISSFGSNAMAQSTLEQPAQEQESTAGDDQAVEPKADQEQKPATDQDEQAEKSSDDSQSSDSSDQDEADEQQDQDQNDEGLGKEDQDSEDQDSEEADEERGSRRSLFNPWGRRSNKISKKASEFVSVFEPVVASMKPATVRIFSGDEQVALGTVIEADGLILTKASELRQSMKVEVGDQSLTPEIVGIHPETDLALLKVDAQSMNVVQWSDQPTLQLGHWVASPKAEGDEPAIGIIATTAVRVIPPSRPFIGINMDNHPKGVRITTIVNKSPAELAGLQVNDLIYEIDGEPIGDMNKLRQALGQYDVGDRITVGVIRFGEEKSIKLTLAERDKVSPDSQRSIQQNSMGSKLSRRRKDFPNAFQHDSMLNSNTCGGPIVDLSGKAIGINIARDGRVSSLALPVATVLPVIEMLKTGELAPAVVNADKIAAIEAELKEMADQLDILPEKKTVLNNRFNAERAREQEIDRMLKELQSRKDEVAKKVTELKDELDAVRKKLRSGTKVREKLEKDLEQLKTGSSR